MRKKSEAAADLDVVARDVLPAGDARRDGGRREELHGVAQRRLRAHLAQHVEGVVVDLRVQRGQELTFEKEKKALAHASQRDVSAFSW